MKARPAGVRTTKPLACSLVKIVATLVKAPRRSLISLGSRAALESSQGLPLTSVCAPARPWSGNHPTSPATTLMVMAMIAMLNTYDSSACRNTVERSVPSVIAVSDTWNVIPTVNARYAKSR